MFLHIFAVKSARYYEKNPIHSTPIRPFHANI